MRIAAREGLRGFAIGVFRMTVLRAALVMSNVVSRAEAGWINTPVRAKRPPPPIGVRILGFAGLGFMASVSLSLRSDSLKLGRPLIWAAFFVRGQWKPQWTTAH
jgi:hypothetical protein